VVRILHVAQPTTAGVPRVVVDLVADQASRGWDVHVACPSDGWLAEEAAHAGARWHPWAATRWPGPDVAGEARRLAALVAALRPDVVHLHSSKAGLAGRLAVRGRVPTVFQPHAWSFLAASGPVGRGAVAWERAAARWTDVVAVVSEPERRAGEAAGVRATYRVVPNGVDVARRVRAAERSADDTRRELGLDCGDWVVCPGRLCRQKGQDLLLRAWPQVQHTVPTARLVFVGGGPDAAMLREAAPDDVVFAGPAGDLDPWLVAADVVALPSRWEAHSLVMLEAMAVGRSVVAGDAGGMAETLDGRAGTVVDPSDTGLLAEAVVRRLLDSDLRAREGAAGRKRASAHYDLATTTGRVADLYEELRRR